MPTATPWKFGLNPMKISICDGKKRFVIRLPLFVLKSKLVCSVLKKNVSQNARFGKDQQIGEAQSNENESLPQENGAVEPSVKQEFVPTPEFMKQLYAVLRASVRANGHFDLVDVQSSDGETVKITI